MKTYNYRTPANLTKYLNNFTFDRTIFKFSNSSDILFAYLNDYANNTTVTLSTRNVSLSKRRNICYKFFKNLDINSLTFTHFQKIIANSNSSEFYILVNIFIYLLDNKYLQVKLIEKITPIHLLLQNSINREFFLRKVIKLDLIDKVFIRNLINSHHKYTPLILNTNSIILISLLKEFIEEYNTTLTFSKEVEYFFDNFDNSLLHININKIEDFNEIIFEKQFYFFKDKKICLRILVNFYLFINKKHNTLFTKNQIVNLKYLRRHHFIKEFKDGYRLVFLNPLDPIPTFDKWILDPNHLAVSANESSSTLYQIDFSQIKCETFRNYYKLFIWKSNQTVYTKVHMKSNIFYFFNYFSYLNNNLSKLTAKDIIFYKNNIMSKYSNPITINSYISSPRVVLLFLEELKLFKFKLDVKYHLNVLAYSNINKAEAIPDENLKKLAKAMNIESKKNLNNTLFYVAFYLLLETELRSSQIFNLDFNCVKDTFKQNQYTISSRNKVSNGENVEVAITNYVKQSIDSILLLNTELRSLCNDIDLKKHLFLGNSVRKNRPKKLDTKGLNQLLKKCCINSNIPVYTTCNLRDTHITKASEKILRENLSPIQQKILTGHASTTTDSRYYIDVKISEMLELTYETIIGNYTLSGKVKSNCPDILTNDTRLVSNDCGYCQNDFCKNTSYLSCLLCESFVATLDRIPFFEEQIKVLNFKIKTSINHDKEDYINIRELFLFYLKELYIEKELTKNV